MSTLTAVLDNFGKALINWIISSRKSWDSIPATVTRLCIPKSGVWLPAVKNLLFSPEPPWCRLNLSFTNWRWSRKRWTVIRSCVADTVATFLRNVSLSSSSFRLSDDLETATWKMKVTLSFAVSETSHLGTQLHTSKVQNPMKTSDLFYRCRFFLSASTAGAWIWPLMSLHCRVYKGVALHIYSPYTPLWYANEIIDR